MSINHHERLEHDEPEGSLEEEYVKPRLLLLGTLVDATAGAPGPMSDGGTDGVGLS